MPYGWIIHKMTRFPEKSSYSGSTWDSAGIREQWKEVYSDQEEAERLAKILTKHNPVGFEVSRIVI